MIFKLLLLYVRMLRYRAALMIWMFLLLGAAQTGEMKAVDLDHLWAVLALASSYVFATTINDLADEAVDRINHPGDEGRPLVTGTANRRDLQVLGRLAFAFALVPAGLIGEGALGVVAAGLLIALAYSAYPLRASYRTYASPLLLGAGYVAVPYALGVEVEHVSFGSSSVRLLGALSALFLARIVLKDFRDSQGDALCGKPTLLLRFGKQVTLGVSATALVTGDVLLVNAMESSSVLIVMTQLFFVGIAYTLHRLRKTEDARMEQVMIGIGARLGNGLLISVLGWLLLTSAGAPEEHRVVFIAVVSATYAWNFLVLRSRPHQVLIGYKG
jgi:4-hydroxybenzoate polyprenyltransferase